MSSSGKSDLEIASVAKPRARTRPRAASRAPRWRGSRSIEKSSLLLKPLPFQALG